MSPALSLLRSLLRGTIRRRIYLTERVPTVSGDYGGRRFDRIGVRTADGLAIAGLRSAPRSDARYTLLYFHGNGGCAATRAPLVEPLVREGADVVVADYRGYGDNPGRPTEAGLMADARAFLDHARATRAGPLVLFGHSLGGAIAIALAADDPREVCALITLGTFASLRARAPAFARDLLPDAFDAAAAAPRVAIPWTILHETDDEVTSVAHAHALFEASGAPGRVRLRILTGGSHALDAAKLSAAIHDALAPA
ncbi:alpha/beta hydrolase [Salinarimonas chemoclinalis]|uniref:alpha/beta hydrolase n=1 Tax=Salinarimonas chemoclinalis TaxID=3241599 RepID=UPI003555DB33